MNNYTSTQELTEFDNFIANLNYLIDAQDDLIIEFLHKSGFELKKYQKLYDELRFMPWLARISMDKIQQPYEELKAFKQEERLRI